MCLDCIRRYYSKFIQATLVIFVLGTFFSDNPTFLNIIKWIGVIYLLYLAYDVYKSSPKEINSEIITSKSFFSFLKMVF
jgi:threonine/homoserine/homoserine lactone efflux protein